jgi:sugar phosphate permease
VSGEPDPLSPHHSPPRVRVRWNIFLYLFGFGFVAYFQQRGITVASYDMMPQLHLTQMQIGWLLWWMLLG